MRCDQIMKKNVECLTENDSILTASRRMRDTEVGFLPICDSSGRVLGTLTDRDIVIRVCAENRDIDKTRAGEVMTREVIACRPEDDLRKAEELMGRHRKSRILVTEAKGKLLGVISLSDVAEEDAGHAAQTMREVASRETHPHS